MWELKTTKLVYVFDTLDEAITEAKCHDEFVTIINGSTEIVGKFGVDAIKNNTLPDGTSYSWKKRRD